MSRFTQFLKERKVCMTLIFLILLPISLAYIAWLTDMEWWRESRNTKLEDLSRKMEMFGDLDNHLANVRCPARTGLELTDYWKCLWATSITAEGLEQHQRILWRNYVDRVNAEKTVMERWNAYRTMKNGSMKKRVRRQAQISPEDLFAFYKSNTIFLDNYVALVPYFRKEFKNCQQRVRPAKSLQDFLLCVRQISLDPQLANLPPGGGQKFGDSFIATFQPTTYPPINESVYEDKEFFLLKMEDIGETDEFKVDFKPLGNEEQMSNFEGADPYFEDDWSVYRYKYKSLDTKQRQPGWSYRGLYGSKDWHLLDLEKFYQPVKKSTDLSKTEFIADFAQTYPGIGELAEELDKLEAPLDYRWTKDSGFNIYTRYLLPLLQKDDLDYYKLKGLIEPSVTKKPDVEVLQDIIDGLQKFENESSPNIVFPQNDTLNPNYTTPEDAPFSSTYYKIVQQFFGVDLSRYKSIKNEAIGRDFVGGELESIRKLLRAYVNVAKTQEYCVKEMVQTSEYRLENPEELELIYKKAIEANDTCKTAPTFDEAVEVRQVIGASGALENDENDWDYKIIYDNLKYLYHAYFDRKENRQRYSLPKYPVEFPICKNNDPSPIDIRADQTRHSSIKDYTFGSSAYRLNRFFMFFPLDGSPLLTVGIVNGERLDDSSVQLSGGAIRGQNLTFQYMHIRIAESWKGIGSEHWIDGKGAPMELQMVFTIAGSSDHIKYWHVLARIHNQLFQFREKLVVILSVLVDVLETEEALKKKFKEDNILQDPYMFEPLAQAAYHFRKMPEKYPTYEQPRGYVSLDPVFRFIDFIPKKSGKFYTYRGGLTWPPCFGYVLWSVYEQRLYMTKRQFDQFANIPAYGIHETNFVRNNFREFEDIYVEEENEPNINTFKIEELKRLRTVDRSILVGYHEGTGGKIGGEDGVVGEDIYFIKEGGCSGLLEGQFVRVLYMVLEVIFILVMQV